MIKPFALVAFAGVGGSGLGLQQAGFETYSIEIDKAIADIHRDNLGECQTTDILEIKPEWIKYAIGTPGIFWLSPPCQAHSKSAIGKSKSKTKAREDGAILSDLIDNHWFSTIKSSYVVLENVPEFRKAPCFSEWCQHLIGLGYSVIYDVLDAADFGVPTRRKRLIAIAALSNNPLPVIEVPYSTPGWLEVIGHLISDMADSELTDGQQEYLANNPVETDQPYLIERSGYYNGKPKIALVDEPLWTLRKSIGTDQKGANRSKFINVVLPDGTVKDLSVQGLAMLQGFPENYKWESVGASVSGIGNSVSPPLAKVIGEGVMKELNIKTKQELIAA